MNLGEASIVLRHRPGLEVVDLALRFVRSVAPKQFLKLGALFLLPAFLLSLALRAGGLPWTAVWFFALVLSKVLELPFTILCGRLLFEPTAPLREILGESARALGRTLVAYALYGLFLFASLLLVVGPLFVGASYFFLPEVLALEKSGPFRAFKRSHQFLGGRSGTGVEGLMLSLGLVLSFIFFAEILGQATLEYVLVVHLPIESLWEDGGSPLALLGLFAAAPYVATHRFLAYTNERTRQDGWDIQVAFLRLAAKPRSTIPPGVNMRPSYLVRGAAFVLLLTTYSSAQRDDPPVEEAQLSEEPPLLLSPDQKLHDDVEALLDDEGYRFCTDPKYRLFEAEKSTICHQLPALEGRCPKLAAACARPPWEADMQLDADESWFDWSFLDLDARPVAALFKVVFWLALALCGFLLLRALIRQARQWREERTLEQQFTIAAPTAAPETDSEELRSQVLFEMARTELQNNNVTQSLHLTYRATVRAMCDAEWVKPHPSKTSGDYLRQLRKVESADPTLPVLDLTTHLLELDRERFRDGPRPERAEGLLTRATELVRRLPPKSALLLLFLALGCDFGNMPEPPEYPQAPRGLQLFEDLMRLRAGSVTRRLTRVTEIPEATTTVVALNAPLRPFEWKTLEEWTSRGGHLMVAAPSPEFASAFHLSVRTDDCSAPLTAPELSLVTFGTSRSLVGKAGARTLARCGARSFAESGAYGDGWLTIVADAAFFDNIHLTAADNSSLAFHLLGNLGQHVEYLGPFTGQGAQHPLESVGRAGFTWWVLHVLLLGALYAWSRGKRFGTPVDPPEAKRRAFSEHSRALSLKYEQSGASGWVLRNYAEWVIETLRRRAQSTRGDLKSLARAVSSNDQEATRLFHALTTARRADELGQTRKEHITIFLKLKSALLGTSEVSRRSKDSKE